MLQLKDSIMVKTTGWDPRQTRMLKRYVQPQGILLAISDDSVGPLQTLHRTKVNTVFHPGV